MQAMQISQGRIKSFQCGREYFICACMHLLAMYTCLIWCAVLFVSKFYTSYGSKNKLSFYTNINSDFVTKQNHPGFNCIIIDLIFIAQKLLQFLLHTSVHNLIKLWWPSMCYRLLLHCTK